MHPLPLMATKVSLHRGDVERPNKIFRRNDIREASIVQNMENNVEGVNTLSIQKEENQ